MPFPKAEKFSGYAYATFAIVLLLATFTGLFSLGAKAGSTMLNDASVAAQQSEQMSCRR